MQYIRLEQVSKSYGEKVLFKDINLTLSKGDKVAIVAKNGSGKSTLLRVIEGSESAEGELSNVWRSKDIRTFFLKQAPVFHESESILENILNTDIPAVQILKAYKLAQAKNDTEQLEGLLQEMDDLKAWDTEAKILELLSKLNLPSPDTKVNVLSGGQQKRLAIVKMILSESDLLILDEPTNHLDLDIIEWLEEYLTNDRITVLMVTHDRYFLERICSEIIELDEGELFTYRGSYSDFLEKKSLRLQNSAVVKEKYKQLYKKELDWIRRQPKARGTKAKSRVDDFDRIKKEAKKKRSDDEVKIMMKSARIGGKILEAYTLRKSYGDLKILEDFSYKFKKGERLGVVGSNGVGKSTLIKILMGTLRPDHGRVLKGDTIEFGYYSQEGMELKPNMRVIDVVREVAEYVPLDKGKR